VATSEDALPNDAMRAEMDQRLRAERAVALDQIAVLSGQLESIISASADVATDDEHDPEGQTIAFERAQTSALLERARIRIADIDAAHDRLAIGTYGICEACGRPIGIERLQARPAARTCIGCASRTR
jgi:RNA polymerase-binding protein DksA